MAGIPTPKVPDNTPAYSSVFDNATSASVARTTLADSLKNKASLEQAAVASRNGNDIAGPGTFIHDLKTRTYGELALLYGRDVANNASNYLKEASNQASVMGQSRSLLGTYGDATNALASGFVGMSGNSAAAILSVAGSVDKYFDPTKTGFSDLAAKTADMTNKITATMNNYTTPVAKQTAHLDAIAAQLDHADTVKNYDNNIARGMNPLVAGIKRFSDSAYNQGKRLIDNPVVAGQTVAGALGSTFPSMKMASAGVDMVAGVTKRLTKNATAKHIATAVGSSLGVGAAEAFGVYGQTVSAVMARTPEEMKTSSMYLDLVKQGKTPHEAQVLVADSAGAHAATIQFPVAAATGLISHRFNASPAAAVADKSFMGVVKEVGVQTLEEAIQSGTGGASQNYAMKQIVDPSQYIGDSLGSQTVQGGFGGLGMAGVMSSPRAAITGVPLAFKGTSKAAKMLYKGATSNVASSIIQHVASPITKSTTYAAKTSAPVTVPVGKVVVEGATIANKNVVTPVAKGVFEGAKAGASKLGKVLDPVVSPIVAPIASSVKKTATHMAERPNRKLQVAAVSAGIDALALISHPETKAKVQAVTDLVVTFADPKHRVSQMSDSAILAASVTAKELASVVNTLSGVAKAKAVKLLSAPDFKRVAQRLTLIDQSVSQTPDTQVTTQSIQDTINLAKTNPANVNPSHVDKILKHKNRKNISSTDIHYMQIAAKLASIVNQHSGQQVQVNKGKNVTLSTDPNSTKGAAVTQDNAGVSRSIQIDGFKSASGQKLPSVNQLASDILQGIQAKDNTYVSADGVNTPVTAVTKQLGMLAQHLANKVAALNASITNASPNGSGSNEQYTSIVNGTHMAAPGEVGNARSVAYHRNNPNSVKNARSVYNDAVATAAVYNTLSKAFPEHFSGKEVVVPPLIDASKSNIKTNTKTNTGTVETTTAVEGGTSPQAMDPTEQTKSKPSQNKSQDANQLGINDNVPPAQENTTQSKIKKTQTHTHTQTEYDAMSPSERLASVNSRNPKVISTPMNDFRAKSVLKMLAPVLKSLGLSSDLVKQIAWIKNTDVAPLGNAFWIEGVMSFRPKVVRRILDGTVQGGLHVLYHEFMHLIDGSAIKGFGTASHSDLHLKENHEVYNEIQAMINSNPEMATYFKYAMSFSDAKIRAAELFAELGALMILDPKLAKSQFPKGVAYVEEIIQRSKDRSQQRNSTKDSQRAQSATAAPDGNTAPDPTSTKGVSTEGRTLKESHNVTSVFKRIFSPKKKDVSYSNAKDIFEAIPNDNGVADRYLEFAKYIVTNLMVKANERLVNILISKADGRTITQAILDGSDLTGIRDYKVTMLVDPHTMQYDSNLLSIAALVVADWLSTVRPTDPSRIGDTLKYLNTDISSISHEDLHNIMFGVVPRQVSESLSKTIMDLWNVKPNPNGRLVDARGAVEGLVKELLTVLAQNSEYISLKDIPIIVNGKKVKTTTIMLDNLRATQEEIGLEGQGLLLKTLRAESSTVPSIGAKITTVDTHQLRSNVPLSATEQTAIKSMQDTGHLLSVGLNTLVDAIGETIMASLSGVIDVTNIVKGHPYRNSVEGKNLSILRGLQEAHMVTSALKGQEDQPVYYHVSITKVGRHQYRGINPENNKFLRALVTPTNATLDMTKQEDNNAFWLTVAQASELHKVENEVQSEILANIQSEFAQVFGKVTDIVQAQIKTGNLDVPAFQAAMEKALNGEPMVMAQLDAIYAVASLQSQSQSNEGGTTLPTSFHTSLAFELDGKTDGPANMMANFGQGLISVADFMNFKRIGFFLGSKTENLQNFIGRDGNLDLYNFNSQEAQKYSLDLVRSSKVSDAKKELYTAVSMFAANFGNFQINQDGSISFTRTSSKGPVTQTVYGSGFRGISNDIADEMLTGLYKAMLSVPKGANPEEFLGYPGLKKDFKTIFKMNFPTGLDWKQNFISKGYVDTFKEAVTNTIGIVLSETTKNTIGAPVTRVNDALVKITGLQSEFVIQLFNRRLEVLAEKRAIEGSLPRNAKGVPVYREMTLEDYASVVRSVQKFIPTYTNGVQTLVVGDFANQASNLELSSTLEGSLRMKSTLRSPQAVGVKVIPFITQGRGDAMMMNNIYGVSNAPTDTMPVFDGVNLPISKIFEYAPSINKAVMKNWESNVLEQVQNNFSNFLRLALAEDSNLLNTVYDNMKVSEEHPVDATNVQELLALIMEMNRQNAARTDTYAGIPLSVDHMSGSGVTHTQGPDTNMTLDEINAIIALRLAGKSVPPITPSNDTVLSTAVDLSAPANKALTPPTSTPTKAKAKAKAKAADHQVPVLTTDTNQLLATLAKSTKSYILKATIKVLQSLIKTNMTVVIDPTAEGGSINLTTNVMTLTDVSNHETVVHELMHMATFDAIYEHYSNKENNPTVTRLESLMTKFMEMTFKGKKTNDAANAAKAQILEYQNATDSYSKAAALSEFLSWTLSNAKLIAALKTHDTGASKLVKTVQALLQRLLGKIPKNMFENILFNTAIITAKPDGSNGSNGSNGNSNNNPNVNGGNNDNNNTDGELTNFSHKFTNFWIDLVRQRLQDMQSKDLSVEVATQKIKQFKRYAAAAQNAVDKLDFGGFNLSEYQKQTFRAIHMVIATELTLDASSSIAINKVFEYVTNNLTPEMFGKGRNGQERYAAIRDLLGDTSNDQGVSDAIAVLLALSQTSKGFRDGLDQLPVPDKTEINKGSLNEFLTSVTGILMNKAVGSIDLAGKSSKDVLDALALNLIKEDTQNEFAVLRTLMSSITKADSYLSGLMGKLSDFAAATNEKVHRDDRAFFLKLTTSIFAIGTAALSSERAAYAAEGVKELMYMGVSLDQAVPVQELISEIIGTDKTNAKVTALLSKVTTAISSMRQNFLDTLPVVFVKAFHKQLDTSQWKAAHHVLAKLDLASLFDSTNPDVLFNLIKNKAALTAEIGKAEEAIRKESSNNVTNKIFSKARQLAGFLNNQGAGYDLWRNAYAINVLSDNSGSNTPIKSMTDKIDRLVSLYALQGADPAQKEAVSNMYKNDPEATKNLITYLVSLNTQEKTKAGVSDVALMNGYKGYVPNHSKSGISMIVANDENRETLEQRGYIRVADYTAESGFSMISRGYYVTSTKQDGVYSQGALQSINRTYFGVDITTGETTTGNTSGTIVGSAVVRVTKSLNADNGVANNKEVLLPVYAKNHTILFYERAMNPDLITQYKAPPGHLAKMLGVWTGRQIEELLAQQYNDVLIKELKKVYDARAHGQDKMFVDISSPNLTDAVYKDSWRVIPDATKQTIKDTFGANNGFWVRKDMINISLGYRDPSIVDIWTGKTRIPESIRKVIQVATAMIPGKGAQKILAHAEQGIQSTVSYAKDQIVVRSLIVPYMNTQANVIQLSNRGVGTKRMIEGYRDKTAEIEQYNLNQKKIVELNLAVLMAANDPNRAAILAQQLQIIYDQNSRMSIAPLIEAGAYKNISEGMTELDIELTAGRMGAWMENQINKLPLGAQTVVKYGILSKDTALYKFANKAVQYGDFIAKAIMYDHLLNQGMTNTEALTVINEEYVDFLTLPGRTRSALESYGLTWFLTFKIRSMKIAMQMMRDNPLRSLAVASTIGSLGSPVNDNLATVVGQNRFGRSLGWGMLFNAPSLNPWVNLTN